MKQRLLLALLVLFASVGMGNAAVTITVPAKSSATIKWTLKENGTIQPTLTGPTSSPITDKVTSAQLDNTKGTSLATYTLTGGDAEILSFSGKITSFTTETKDLSELKELSFASGMGLSTLTLDESILNNLTKLSIGSNNLSTVPSKKDNIKTYQVSEQSPENFPLNMQVKNQSPSNKPLDITLNMILGEDHAMAGETDFTLEGWQYKGSNGTYSSTSYAHTDASAPHRYYFFSGGSTTSPYQDGYEYMDGDFRCNIKFGSQSDYPGVVIKNIPVKVLPAKYTMKAPAISPKETGEINVLQGNTPKFNNNNNDETVSKGDEFILIPNARTGYSFSKFESSGITITKVENSDQYKAVVNGKATPSLKGVFTAEGQPITIQTPSNGAIEVYDGTTSIKNGDKIATGKKIKIHAIPNDGYMVDKLQINGTTQTSFTKEGKTQIYEYPVTGTEAIVITASFVQNTSSKLTLKWKDDTATSIQLDGQNGSSSDDNDYKTKSYEVAFNTKPTIKIQTKKGFYLSSIVASNNVTVNYQIVEKENEKSGTTYLISDFVMPNTPVSLVINTSERSEAKILVDANPGNPYKYKGTLIYDGTEKTIPYITEPNNLSGVVVEYNTASASDVYYTKTGFINAGDNYVARFSRPADNIYKAATVYATENTEITDGKITFEIIAATPLITTEPTVTIDKDGKYVISGGTVKYARGNQQISIDSKKYVWTVVNQAGTSIEKTALSADQDGKYSSEVVKVRLNLKDNVNKDYDESNRDKNFKDNVSLSVKAKGQKDNIKNVTVEIYSKLPEGTTLTMKNGTKSLGTKATVSEGTEITFDLSAPGYEGVKIAQVDINGYPIKNSDGSNIEIDASKSIKASGEKMIFKITSTKAPKELIELVLISAEDKNHAYNGKVQAFDTKVISVKDKKTNVKETVSDWSKATVTYKEDATGKATTAPINAGTYTVTIVRPADGTYKAFTATGSMIVEQDTPDILTLPNNSKDNAALIGKGMELSTAVLTGGVANVDGTFEWVNPTQIVNVDGQYEIKFVSKDPNYKDVVVDDTNGTYKAYVKVTDKAVLSLATDPNYTITAKGSDGKNYSNGMTVPVGTTLTFTVSPASTYKLKALYVNGKEISGNTYKTTAGPISVKAEVTQEFTIAVTKPSKGAIVTLPSSNKVKKGESYSFTVACLAADKSKIVVKDGSTVITGTDGKYTISNITADKNISITLDSPTAITVAADTTLSPHKKPMGTVTITGVTDGKCYYGETVTVKATPVSGVQFAGWTGTTETTATFSFKATQPSYKFKAKYTGSPTGIETIEGVRVYGSQGYIYVGCNGEAKVTIISMEGRLKKINISGDTRIEMHAGTYGVILEKGSEVMKTKVIVR